VNTVATTSPSRGVSPAEDEVTTVAVAPGGSDELPTTGGFDPWVWVPIGLSLVIIGGLFLLVEKRKV
jgi:LPXTG-motif cell wall-anchored protein